MFSARALVTSKPRLFIPEDTMNLNVLLGKGDKPSLLGDAGSKSETQSPGGLSLSGRALG